MEPINYALIYVAIGLLIALLGAIQERREPNKYPGPLALWEWLTVVAIWPLIVYYIYQEIRKKDKEDK